MQSVWMRSRNFARKSACRFVIAAMALAVATTAGALDVGSDGSDGELNLTGSGTTTIDLSQAMTRLWDMPGAGTGVYDSTKWAVVFKYSSVNIGAGRTVNFINHPSWAPVVWLVQGNVTIAGTVSLNGSPWLPGGQFAPPGPGGFRGGKTRVNAEAASAGFGPGGGVFRINDGGGGGSYATAGTYGGPTYGNVRVLPLIGGSGGGGRDGSGVGGAGGGGAILIAANGTVTVTGNLQAVGGSGALDGWYPLSGGGSGGGIRLIASVVAGNAGGLQATGGAATQGGLGRIRVEANSITMSGDSSPLYTRLTPLADDTAVIWPTSDLPRLRVTSIGGMPAPADPHGVFSGPGDVWIVSTSNVAVVCEAENVPTDGTWTVKLRVAPTAGAESYLDCTLAGGNQTLSTWTTVVPSLPVARCSAMQARAFRNP